MEAPFPAYSPEDLLAQSHGIRALALRLVREPADADDLVQDTWVAALQHPPRAGRPAWPWLARVLTNFARRRRRAEGRRRDREEAAATLPPLPSGEELAMRLDLHQQVVSIVRELEEPYRSTVLLRYFEDLSVTEIAERQSVPPATVRQRLKRARERLRAKFDQRFGGDGHTWRSALLALVASHASREVQVGKAAVAGSRTSGPALVSAAIGVVFVAGAVLWIAAHHSPRDRAATPAPLSVLRAPPSGTSHEARSVAPAQPTRSSRVPALGDQAGTRDATALFGAPDASAMVANGIAAVGAIVDSRNKPVPDAEVWVFEIGSSFPGHVETRADEEGRFRVSDLTLEHLIGARARGYAPSILQPIRGRPGEEWPVRIVLDRPGTEISGAVVDANGRAVAAAEVLIGAENAEVILLPDSREGRTPPPLWCRADDQGNFRITSAPVGIQLLRARADGYGTARVEVDVPAAGLSGLELALEPEARVAGRVMAQDGRTVEGARVYTGEGNAFGDSTAVTDSAGAFEVAGLSPGLVEMHVEHESAGSAVEEFRIAASEVRAWNATLKPTPRIHGILLDEQGRALGGWELSLYLQRTEQEVQHRVTDRDGQFCFSGVSPELHDLSVDGRDAWMELPYLVLYGVAPSDQPLRVQLSDLSGATGTVTGIVLDPQGRPASGVMVTGWQDETRYSWYGITPDQRNGRFEIARIPPGRLRVEVRSSEWPWLNAGDQEIQAGDRIDLGILKLQPPAFASGTITGGSIEDLARVSLHVYDEEMHDVGQVEIRGRQFRSPPLAPGVYLLWLEAEGFETATAKLIVERGIDQLCDLTLRPAGVRRVMISTEEDAAPEWTWCWVFDEAGERRWKWSGLVAKGGRELRVSLAPGTYRLEVKTSAGREASASIVVLGYGEEPEQLLIVLGPPEAD